MKIILTDGYFIETDNYNLILKRERTYTGKDGKEKTKVEDVGYYGNLKHTISAFLKEHAMNLAEDETLAYTVLADRFMSLFDKKADELVTYIEGRM